MSVARPDHSPSTSDPPLIVEGLFSYQIGGSERVGADLAIAFRERGYRVVCFAMYDATGPFKDQLELQGIECVDLNYVSRLRGLRRVSYQVELYRFLRRRKAHALHVHHATALVLCGIPARLAGVKHVVMTEHAIHQLQERPNYRRQAARYCRYATAITAVHAGIADYFHSEMHVPRSRLHTIENGVRQFPRDAGNRARVRQALQIPDDAIVFAYVGRLEVVKDLGTLITAFSLLPPSVRSNARLVIVGDGSSREDLERQGAQLSLGSSVQFLGARNDIGNMLAMADVFAMTSVTEGLPMALIEAMGAGLPCVATAVGGIPGLLADGVGFLAPPGDAAAIAQALQRLALDPALREAVGASAKAKVSALYQLDGVVTSYLALMGLPPRWPAA